MLRCLILAVSFATIAPAACPPAGLDERQTLERFKELDREASAAFEAERYAVAVAKYGEAACLVPISGRAFYGLGVAQAALNDFAFAAESLRSADRLLPSSPMPLAMLVRVQIALGQIEPLKETLRSLAARFPADSDLHAGLARLFAEKQMLDLALAESLRFEAAGGQDPAPTVALAALENRVGAFEDAIRQARRIQTQSALPPSIRAAAAGIAGLSHESRGERDEAIRDLKLAIELSPREENSYLSLAYLYEKNNRFRDAALLLERGRKNLPDSVSIRLALGSHLVWAEQFDAGIQILTGVLNDAPDRLEAYVRLAEAYRKKGQPDAEIQTLRKLAAAKPDYPMIHVLTAKALLSAPEPDYAQVLAELAQAETATPTDADVYYLRGKALLATQHYEDAVAPLKRAIALQPTEPSPYYQLGIAYRKLGQTALAKQQMDRMQFLKNTGAPLAPR